MAEPCGLFGTRLAWALWLAAMGLLVAATLLAGEPCKIVAGQVTTATAPLFPSHCNTAHNWERPLLPATKNCALNISRRNLHPNTHNPSSQRLVLSAQRVYNRGGGSNG